MKNISRILLAVVGMSGTFLWAGGDHPPITGSAELERMKALAGRWEGTTTMGKEPQKAAVEYAVTSNGSAVEEKLFPGTPHEMVSIYYDRGGKLAMTHYCAMGNQPRMDLAKADAQGLEFSLGPDCGVNGAKDAHMHSLKLATPDKDHLTQTWTSWADGKQQDSTVITLTRAK
jgi:hypothetical protein